MVVRMTCLLLLKMVLVGMMVASDNDIQPQRCVKTRQALPTKTGSSDEDLPLEIEYDQAPAGDCDLEDLARVRQRCGMQCLARQLFVVTRKSP